MRGRIQNYLPIVLIAVLVQIFAPIGACWAAVVAVSDPLGGAAICHDTGAAPGHPTDQDRQHNQHGGACAICCLASASASVDTPKVEAYAAPYRQTARIVWRGRASDVPPSRAGSNAQARGPPPSV